MSTFPLIVRTQESQSVDTFFVSGRVPWRSLVINFTYYFLIACFLRIGFLPEIASSFLGGVNGDAGLYVWLIKSNLRDLFTLQWFSTSAFYPYTLSLGWSDNYIFPSLLCVPFLKLGLPLPFVYNLVHLAASAMNGLAVFILLTHLTNFPRHAFFAGVAFMSLGVFAAHLGHPQLQWAFFLPLLLVGAVRIIHERSLASGVLTGLFFSACLATTAYYAVFGAVLVAAFVAAVAVSRPERFCDRRYLWSLLGGVVGLIPALPLLVPYFRVRDVFGGREIYEAHYFSASPLSYLSASSFSWLYHWTSRWSHSEAQLFPGLVLLGLAALTIKRLWGVPPLRKSLTFCGVFGGVLLLSSALVGTLPGARVIMALCSWALIGSSTWVLFRLGRLESERGFKLMTNRGLIAIFFWIFLLFFLISLGPLGNPEKGQFALGIYQFFYWLYPGFDAVRAIGRAGIVTSLGLVILYAFYLTHFVRSTRVFIALTSLIVIENFPRHFPVEAPLPKPAVFSSLEAIPDIRDAAVVLPLATQFDEYRRVRKWSEYANLNIAAMLWGFDSGRFFVNGYSGQRSKVMKELPYYLSGFPDKKSLKALGRIGGLRYIVYRGGVVPEFNEADFEKRLSGGKGQFSILAKQGQDYLLEFWPVTDLLKGAEVLFPPIGGAEIELWINAHSNEKETEVELVIGDSDFKTFAFQGAATHKVQLKLPNKIPPGRPVVVSIFSKTPAELIRTRVLTGLFGD